MKENGSADNEMRRLKDAEHLENEACRKRGQAEDELKQARAAYAAARPLTEQEREMLAKHVESDGALCCEKGLAWLSEHLPEPWATAIHEWAYEALGCGWDGKSDARWRPEYVAKVRALKLDRFPNT